MTSDPTPDPTPPTPRDRRGDDPPPPTSLEDQVEKLQENLTNLNISAELPEVPSDEEIEARIRAATGGRDLKAFRKSIDRAQRGGADAPKPSERSDVRGTAVGLHVAYVLLGLPLAGAALGWLVDRWLGTTWGVGAGTLILAVLALTYVITILNRENQR